MEVGRLRRRWWPHMTLGHHDQRGATTLTTQPNGHDDRLVASLGKAERLQSWCTAIVAAHLGSMMEPSSAHVLRSPHAHSRSPLPRRCPMRPAPRHLRPLHRSHARHRQHDHRTQRRLGHLSVMSRARSLQSMGRLATPQPAPPRRRRRPHHQTTSHRLIARWTRVIVTPVQSASALVDRFHRGSGPIGPVTRCYRSNAFEPRLHDATELHHRRISHLHNHASPINGAGNGAEPSWAAK